MRRGSAGGPVEHLANESGAHHSGADAARAIAQFAVVAHHHETIGATGIGVAEDLSNNSLVRMLFDAMVAKAKGTLATAK